MVDREHHDTTSGYGRGMLQLALANAAYVLTAYVVTTITARVLEPADFGTFGVVMAWITILTALLVKGLATSTAREMAAGRVEPVTAWRAGRSLGIRLAIGLAVIGIAASPLAAVLFNSTGHAEQFAIGALGAFTFGVNAVLLAWPTGIRDYSRQALAQVAYALARVALVVGGAIAYGLDGAVVGYVLAPLLSAASIVMRRPADATAIADVRRRMWRHVVPVSLVSVAVTAYFVVDVFALSSVVGEGSPQLGVYVAYGTVAHVPFFLLQAASVAMVPALAAARGAAARAGAIRRTMTDTIVLLAGPTLLLATAGDAAARVVFGRDYQVAELVALPLALATGAVTVLANLVAVDVAVGRLRESLAVAGGGAALVAASAWLVADRATSGQAAAVAWAACVSSLLAMVVLALVVRARHHALLERARTVRGVALASAFAVVPLVASDDIVRTVLAALAGVAWLGLVLRLRLVDLRRGTPVPAALEDPQPPA
ncbi:MAG: oligosaccharide flippase family protein [Thermoleophilia bacterium]|nr:oligosaccharide flippase family protein [Thermoleophilia bacterium]